MAHKDQKQLTILIPLSQNHNFEVRGLAFGWRTQVDIGWNHPQSFCDQMQGGTAIRNTRHVTHAGMTVPSGKRAVFVASISPR